jgi:hypothetical protein
LLASLGIWCFYGPAIVGSFEAGKHAPHLDFRVAVLTYGAVAVLALTTCYSAIVSFRNTEGGKASSWFLPQKKTSGKLRVAVSICSVVLFAGAAGWLDIGVHNARRASSEFLIPSGYKGWVRIEFNVAGAPATAEDQGHYILKIPSDGRLKTSSPERFGWGTDQYFYVSNDVLQELPTDTLKGRLVWGQINGEDFGRTGRKQYEEFFVGTGEQFKQLAGNKEIGPKEVDVTPQ